MFKELVRIFERESDRNETDRCSKNRFKTLKTPLKPPPINGIFVINHPVYAQTLIVVDLIVVNLFIFLKFTRNGSLRV